MDTVASINTLDWRAAGLDFLTDMYPAGLDGVDSDQWLHSDALSAAFGRLDEMAEIVAAKYDVYCDGPVAVRAAFMMVLSTSVFQASLLGADAAMTRDRIVMELGEMFVGAALHRRRS